MPSEYPPPHHLTRDLRLRIERGPTESRALMPIVREIQDARGAASVGALATLIDMHAGALAIEAAQPSWLATLDLAIHLARPLVGKQVETRGSILRAGRQTIALELALATDSDSDAGLATMTYAVLPRRDDTPVYDRDFGASATDLALPDSRLREPFELALGIRVTDAARGEAEVDLSPYVTNSLAALQGGAAATLIDVAARAFGSAELGRAAFTTDLTVRYLALGKRAPIRTRSRLIRRDAGGCLARVEVRESGPAARLCYLGLVSLAQLRITSQQRRRSTATFAGMTQTTLRGISLLGGLLLLLAARSVGAAPPAPVRVAVFDDPAFVDTTSATPFAEADNVQAALASFGFGVTTFAGASGSCEVLGSPF